MLNDPAGVLHWNDWNGRHWDGSTKAPTHPADVACWCGQLVEGPYWQHYAVVAGCWWAMARSSTCLKTRLWWLGIQDGLLAAYICGTMVRQRPSNGRWRGWACILEWEAPLKKLIKDTSALVPLPIHTVFLDSKCWLVVLENASNMLRVNLLQVLKCQHYQCWSSDWPVSPVSLQIPGFVQISKPKGPVTVTFANTGHCMQWHCHYRPFAELMYLVFCQYRPFGSNWLYIYKVLNYIVT